MVKRYGLYARHIKPAFKKALELIHKAKQLLFSFFSTRDRWRQRIINRFEKDPLLCPVCGVEMELCSNAKRVKILHYRDIMLGFVPQHNLLTKVLFENAFPNI